MRTIGIFFFFFFIFSFFFFLLSSKNQTKTVAMDAIVNFGNEQFKKASILRDLNKSYCAFSLSKYFFIFHFSFFISNCFTLLFFSQTSNQNINRKQRKRKRILLCCNWELGLRSFWRRPWVKIFRTSEFFFVLSCFFLSLSFSLFFYPNISQILLLTPPSLLVAPLEFSRWKKVGILLFI